jgi:hypothetical protein
MTLFGSRSEVRQRDPGSADEGVQLKKRLLHHTPYLRYLPVDVIPVRTHHCPNACEHESVISSMEFALIRPRFLWFFPRVVVK